VIRGNDRREMRREDSSIEKEGEGEKERRWMSSAEGEE
jgi:hypothetical protein